MFHPRTEQNPTERIITMEARWRRCREESRGILERGTTLLASAGTFARSSRSNDIPIANDR
jgi:hypothetical protein